MRWYIIHTMSGSERRIKQSILEQVAKKNMGCAIGEIVAPSVEITEMRRGKQVQVEKKFMPGYILVQADMNDDLWHLIRNVPKVSGFLGSVNKPKPVPDKEVEEIFNQLKSRAKDIISPKNYEIGEVIRVIDGAFESFTGTIEEVDSDKKRLRVSVSIFGRATPIDLNFNQVKRD